MTRTFDTLAGGQEWAARLREYGEVGIGHVNRRVKILHQRRDPAPTLLSTTKSNTRMKYGTIICSDSTYERFRPQPIGPKTSHSSARTHARTYAANISREKTNLHPHAQAAGREHLCSSILRHFLCPSLPPSLPPSNQLLQVAAEFLVAQLPRAVHVFTV